MGVEFKPQTYNAWVVTDRQVELIRAIDDKVRFLREVLTNHPLREDRRAQLAIELGAMTLSRELLAATFEPDYSPVVAERILDRFQIIGRELSTTPIDELCFPDVDREWSSRIYNLDLGD